MKNYLNTLRISTRHLAAVYLVSIDDYCFQKLDLALAKQKLDLRNLNVVEYTIARVEEGVWARKHNNSFQDTGFKNNSKIALATADLDASNFTVLYVCFADKVSFDKVFLEFGFMISDKLRLVILPLPETKIDRDSARDIGPGQYVYNCSNDGVLNLSQAYPHYTIPDYDPTRELVCTEVPYGGRKLVKHHPKVKLGLLKEKSCDHPLPTYATSLSSGFDLHACLADRITLHAGETLLIPSGLKVAIPVGYELQIRSRSGLTFKNNVVIANSPATIDCDYAGSVGLLVRNQSSVDFEITAGMKLAQAVLCPIVQAEFDILDEDSHADHFATSDRKGGFGSTGL